LIINSDFEVAQSAEKIWEFFDDIPQVAACLPGAKLDQDLGGGKYKGGVAISMGPVRLNFGGTADIVSKDDANKKIVVNAAGADEKGRGNASMSVSAKLTPRGGGNTKVDVAMDLQLSGAAAQYGRGMISDFTAIMMRDFAANMADRINRLQRGETMEQINASAGSNSVGGIALAMRAARLALARVFGRLFLPYQGAKV
jgi:hypothetical protein